MKINNLMLEDHRIIINLCNEFSNLALKSGEDKESLLKSFEKLSWRLERHLLAEEKEVLTTFQIQNEDDGEIVNRLIKDHKTIMDSLTETKKNLENDGKIECSKIKQPLLSHQLFEEKIFYPRLSEVLEENQKDELHQKINTLISED